MDTLISIVLPIYNEKPIYLQACLESIMGQSFSSWECICVVESSEEDNLAMIKDFISIDQRFKLVRPKKRIGLPASLNLGVAHAKGDLISRMDSDDLMYPSRLKIQYEFVCKNPNISLLGTAYHKIDHNEKVIGTRKYPQSGWWLSVYFMFRCGLAHPTVMFRKNEFEELGGYNTTLDYCEDLELWLRYRRAGARIYNIVWPLTAYRISRRKAKHWKTMLLVRLKYLIKWKT